MSLRLPPLGGRSLAQTILTRPAPPRVFSPAAAKPLWSLLPRNTYSTETTPTETTAAPEATPTPAAQAEASATADSTSPPQEPYTPTSPLVAAALTAAQTAPSSQTFPPKQYPNIPPVPTFPPFTPTPPTDPYATGKPTKHDAASLPRPSRPTRIESPLPPHAPTPPPNLLFHVPRTGANLLPVYLISRNSGTRRQTRVRGIRGQVKALAKQLSTLLALPLSRGNGVWVNEATGHIVIKGDHTAAVTKFLEGIGM